MALTRMVNGLSVPLTAQEETDLLAEWATFVPPVPVDRSDINQIQKEIKALALCVAQVGGLTVAQMKTLFKQKWDSLP